jgi:chaperonin cofactor prefoldin
MRKQLVLLSLLLMLGNAIQAADLPIREVVLYKHGVGYFARSGALAAGDTAQLAFKASEMNDVLKSLTIVDASGAPIAGVRYDASEPVENRLADFPFRMGESASMAAFLDQMKGARLELPGITSGTIISARVTQTGDPARPTEREVVVLLTDAGDIRSVDLSTATGGVRLTEPKLQTMLRDYLTVVGGARSRDRRNVYIDATKQGTRRVTASYMTPSAVWKSSYRLIFTGVGEPTLEGWAIVDNTSGDDWTNVNLSVVSGRPISFITGLYEPRYVTRPTAELAENRAVGPTVYEGAVLASPAPPAARAAAGPGAGRGGPGVGAPGGGGGRGGGGAQGQLALQESMARDQELFKMEQSSLGVVAAGRDLGELFEYRFSTPVTVKQGESAMLPFLQQKLGARKLLIYSENYGLHPMNAAELTNSTGKTLDGGPITVYDANAYAGEALVETLKAGDKRLISYGVDLGTRITTKIDSGRANVREIHMTRGVLQVKNSIQETKTYSINNVDETRKTILIEHPLRQGFTLLSSVKPKEITSTAQRFEVVVGAKAQETFAIQEERIYDQSTNVSNMTPDVLTTWIQNRVITAAGRQALERILAKKREIAANQSEAQAAAASLNNLTNDQQRFRENINTLRSVAGQETLVQTYARQLSEAEGKMTALRDQQAQLQRTGQTLQGELNGLIETAEF